MSFESFLADNTAVALHGDWLVVFHPFNPSDVATPLYFSRRGTATPPFDIAVGAYTIPANTPFIRRLANAPTISHSLWSRGRIGGESQPTYGALQLVNQDGGLDQYRPTTDTASWRWKNTPCQVYFCDCRPDRIADSIGLVFDGLVKEARIKLGDATVDLQGFEARYGEMTSERVFRGTSYMLELFGDRTVDYGTPSAVNITGSMTAEAWLWLEALPTAATVNVWGWQDAAGVTAPWRLLLLSTGALRVSCHISGVQETVTSTLLLSAFVQYHIAFTISGRNVTFYVWNDDAQTLTVEPHVNGFSSATRNSNSGHFYRLRAGSDATLKPWWDEMRVWNVARTADELASTRFGEIGIIPSSLVHYTKMNDGTGTTVTDSSATAANGTISGAGTSTWLWAMEGGPELANTPKCEVWGRKEYVKPVLVDPIRQVYFVCPADTLNTMNDIVGTYEGGNPHTKDANAASLRALMTTAPAAGHSLPYPARGLFRLGSAPTLPVSADVAGFGISASTGLLPDVVEQLITTRLSTTPALDTASFTALAAIPSVTSANFGVFLERPEPMRQVLDFLLAGAEAWWGHLRGEDEFHVEQFAGPAATADYDWDERHIVHLEPLDAQTIIYGVEVKFAQNHVVMTEDQVAAAIKGTANWQRWTQEWQTVRRVDQDIRDKYPGDASVLYTVETGRFGRTYSELFANYLLALLKGPKEAFKVTVKPVGKIVKAGQTVTLSVTLQRGRQRLGLDGTKRYVILDVTDTQQNGETVCTVWGGSA